MPAVALDTSVRWVVTKHVLDLIRKCKPLAGVQIEPGWPGDTIKDEAIWVDRLDGDIDIPVMTGGRKQRDDKFDIPLQFRVAGKASLDGAMSRLGELMGTVESLLADDPGLSEQVGVVAATVTREQETSGDLGENGRLAFGEIVVTVHVRLL